MKSLITRETLNVQIVQRLESLKYDVQKIVEAVNSAFGRLQKDSEKLNLGNATVKKGGWVDMKESINTTYTGKDEIGVEFLSYNQALNRLAKVHGATTFEHIPFKYTEWLNKFAKVEDVKTSKPEVATK